MIFYHTTVCISFDMDKRKIVRNKNKRRCQILALWSIYSKYSKTLYYKTYAVLERTDRSVFNYLVRKTIEMLRNFRENLFCLISIGQTLKIV